MATREAIWFLSAPETSTPRRRGDPLGLRNITDEVAELLAPGLTNRTRDARWLTLLSWSLVESERAWQKATGHALNTAEHRRERYAWLRPLELLWVARSIDLGGKRFRASHWPGHRSLKRWDRRSARFAMTASQLTNYRQSGAYGAYRILFRQSGLTESNDGWTPANSTYGLAEFVKRQLKREGAAPTWRNKPRLADPAHWWISTGWPQWQMPARPNPLMLSALTPNRLHQDEIDILVPLLFPPDSPRLRTAQAIGADRKGGDYVALCRSLAKALPRSGGDPSLSRLGDLAALNNAGVMVLRSIAQCVAEGSRSITALARDPHVTGALEALSDCAGAWRKTARHAPPFTYQNEADLLSQVPTGGTLASLRRFIAHHEQYGSGARWFARAGDEIILIGAEFGLESGSFSYRLHALARLAIQCGVLGTLPRALGGHTVDEDDA